MFRKLWRLLNDPVLKTQAARDRADRIGRFVLGGIAGVFALGFLAALVVWGPGDDADGEAPDVVTEGPSDLCGPFTPHDVCSERYELYWDAVISNHEDRVTAEQDARAEYEYEQEHCEYGVWPAVEYEDPCWIDWPDENGP